MLVAALLAGCTPPANVVYAPAQLPPASTRGAAAARINGTLGTTKSTPPAEISVGRAATAPAGAASSGAAQGGGDISLEFADTDIRAAVAQVLGGVLRANYTIDPAVKGTVTFHTARPLTQDQALAALQTMLAQNNAALIQNGGLYRVVPAAAAATGAAATIGAAGATVVPLRYASAENLAKVLQPVVGTAAHVAPDTSGNALVVSGDPDSRDALVQLIQSFDVNELAGQSYALLPVPQDGDPKDFATTLQDAFRGQTGGGLAGLVRVLPLAHVGAVLVVASQPEYIAAAQRVYSLIQRQQRATVRSWHVYYLQNSHADDTAYLLQRAFTPNDVTAQPDSAKQQNGPSMNTQGGMNSGTGTTSGMNGATGTTGGATLGGGTTGQSTIGQSSAPTTTAGAATSGPAPGGGNPLLGGLGGGGDQNGNTSTDQMRIISNPQNNAVLIYSTPQEENTVEAMLRKVDILPLQVRIDATIAEVTLNDQLKYGTQFFFKEGSVNETLTTAATNAIAGSFPGFVFNAGAKGVTAALSALQAVTTVHVLDSPEVMVLDNQPATLEVGDLVPYLTQSSQSTLVSGSPVINSINYRQTGVIMKVTPRVNSGGLVTLDIAQEVSGIDSSAPTFAAIGSPTFSERDIESRVVVQDSQTVGLAGLITDTISRGNSGIPFLKDVPILGFLTGSQDNERNRTELLVLITPHVVQDQRDARALTQDLQRQLPNAAMVPAESQYLPITGSNNPNANVVRRLGIPQ